jgi:hypothetical protein
MPIQVHVPDRIIGLTAASASITIDLLLDPDICRDVSCKIRGFALRDKRFPSASAKALRATVHKILQMSPSLVPHLRRQL